MADRSRNLHDNVTPLAVSVGVDTQVAAPAAPEPLTIHHIIATHAEMLTNLAYEPIATDPAAFICQLGEVADSYRGATSIADAIDSPSAAITCLSEALDRPEGSPARTEFLQVANRHLYDLAAHALA